MELLVQPAADLPIYRQIVLQIQAEVASGRLAPGSRLPSHRQLAAQLVIAPLTVKKAYDELEREGWLETRRGRGSFVAERPPALAPAERLERLRPLVEQLVAEAWQAGVGLEELTDLLAAVHPPGTPDPASSPGGEENAT